MATHTETNAGVTIRGKNNTVIIQQGTDAQQHQAPAVAVPLQTLPTLPQFPSSFAPAPAVAQPPAALPSTTALQTQPVNWFLPPVDKDILKRAEEIKNCGQLSLNMDAVVVPAPSASVNTAGKPAAPSQFDGLDRHSLTTLSQHPDKAKHLQQMLNELTGSKLTVDGKVGPATIAAAVKAGIIESANNPAIIETELEKLDAQYQQKVAARQPNAAANQKPGHTAARQLDDLSQTELSHLIRVINKETGRSIQSVEPVLLTEEVYKGATEIGIRNKYNGNLDEVKMNALFKEHGFAASAPTPKADAPKADVPATTSPKTETPRSRQPAPDPSADKYHTRFDGTNGRDIGSLSEEQVTAIQNVIASYKNENERYNIVADGVAGDKTRQAAKLLGIIDQNGKIIESRLEGWDKVNAERGSAIPNQASAKDTTLQALVAQYLPGLPSFDFSNAVATVPAETMAVANRTTPAVSGR